MTFEITVYCILALLYVTLNLLVRTKIKKAEYDKEERRNLHLKFIWFVPFLGVVLTKNYWKNEAELKDLEVHTKGKKKRPDMGSNVTTIRHD